MKLNKKVKDALIIMFFIVITIFVLVSFLQFSLTIAKLSEAI